MKSTVILELDLKITLLAFSLQIQRVNANSQYVLHKKLPLTYILYFRQKSSKFDADFVYKKSAMTFVEWCILVCM